MKTKKTAPIRRDDEEQVKREGDVLGISDADPDTTLPFKGRRGGRAPEGIEVGDRVTGLGDIPQRSGASGADLGGHEGADVTPTPPDIREVPDEEKD